MRNQIGTRLQRRTATVVIGLITLIGPSCVEQTEVAEQVGKAGDNQDAYATLALKACTYLKTQQVRCETQYHLGEYDNWYYDEATGHLTFTDPVLPKLVIEYEKVGSVALKSNTWLWAWDNKHTYRKVRSQIERVRVFGSQQGKGFERLTEPVL